jgi:hypothetical protein
VQLNVGLHFPEASPSLTADTQHGQAGRGIAEKSAWIYMSQI